MEVDVHRKHWREGKEGGNGRIILIHKRKKTEKNKMEYLVFYYQIFSVSIMNRTSTNL